MAEKLIEKDITWLVQGRISEDCEMKWDGNPPCGKWTTPKPDPKRAFHTMLYVTQYYELESDSFLNTKRFIERLRQALLKAHVELVVALTHLDRCPSSLSEGACVRAYQENLDIGFGKIVPLSSKDVPNHVRDASCWDFDDGVPVEQSFISSLLGYSAPPTLPKKLVVHGSIAKERAMTGGVYIEPDAMLNLVERLQASSLRHYEHANSQGASNTWAGLLISTLRTNARSKAW